MVSLHPLLAGPPSCFVCSGCNLQVHQGGENRDSDGAAGCWHGAVGKLKAPGLPRAPRFLENSGRLNSCFMCRTTSCSPLPPLRFIYRATPLGNPPYVSACVLEPPPPLVFQEMEKQINKPWRSLYWEQRVALPVREKLKNSGGCVCTAVQTAAQ